MPPLDNKAEKRLKELENLGRRRAFEPIAREDGALLTMKGKRYISFSCNDYLGLSHHPEVVKAAESALHTYGVGAGASRLVTGSHPLYTELEALMAKEKGTEAACVIGSGYLANISLIPALMGKDDLILADRLVHACIVDGIRLSGAAFFRFGHNDLAQLEKQLKEKRALYRECLILTETVFSMDGDLAPVKAMKELAEQYDATLMTDDAHGFGIIEPEARAHIQMGTFSKAAGGYGGYVCASRKLIDYFTNTARGLIFSTALPPSLVAAAAASVRLMRKHPGLARQALSNARLFAKELGLMQYSAIVPLMLGEDARATQAAEALLKHGFLVRAIRPPAVPEGTARLRFTFSAQHREEDILRLTQAIKDEGLAA
jgi:8-amino-7-oxononanoate synthase